MTKKKSKSQSKPAAKKTPARKTKAIKSKGLKKTKADCPDNVCPIKKKSLPNNTNNDSSPPATKESESWFQKVLRRFGL